MDAMEAAEENDLISIQYLLNRAVVENISLRSCVGCGLMEV